MTTPIVRFAPSPTGRIHIGNARVALFNRLFASQHNGNSCFVSMTLISPAPPRLSRGKSRSISPGSGWCRTSRFASPTAARFTRRRRIGCARWAGSTLAMKRGGIGEAPQDAAGARAAAGLRPRRAARFTRGARAMGGRGPAPALALSARHKSVAWRDLIRGEAHIDCASLSDPVLIREDGSFLYTLPSVVDDIDSKSPILFAARMTSPIRRCSGSCSRRWRRSGSRPSSRTTISWFPGPARACRADRLPVDRLAARGGL